MAVIGVLTFAIMGAIYQAVVTEIDQRQLGPAPGEMVSVGDHKLHINCLGQGSPTVVLESGTPGTSVEWSAWVRPEVAKVTRACAYERAGLGWSEAGPGPRDAEQSEQAAQALQSELANLSSNSTHRVIEGSDHGSIITNQHHAQQTSQEILKVVEAMRTG